MTTPIRTDGAGSAPPTRTSPRRMWPRPAGRRAHRPGILMLAGLIAATLVAPSAPALAGTGELEQPDSTPEGSAAPADQSGSGGSGGSPAYPNAQRIQPGRVNASIGWGDTLAYAVSVPADTELRVRAGAAGRGDTGGTASAPPGQLSLAIRTGGGEPLPDALTRAGFGGNSDSMLQVAAPPADRDHVRVITLSLTGGPSSSSESGIEPQRPFAAELFVSFGDQPAQDASESSDDAGTAGGEGTSSTDASGSAATSTEDGPSLPLLGLLALATGGAAGFAFGRRERSPLRPPFHRRVLSRVRAVTRA